MKEIINTYNKNQESSTLFNNLFSSIKPESLISLNSQDIFALHYVLGASFNLKDTIQFGEEIMAPLLNVPISIQGIIYRDMYSPEDELISFVEEKSLKGNFMEQVIEFFKKYETQERPILLDQFKNMNLDIHIRNNYQYNSTYGIPVYVELFKEIHVDSPTEKHKQIESYIIRLEE